MLVPAGLVPFTTIDFPNRLAAVIFFQGCPLRCPFCHNPNLQPPQPEIQTISWSDTIEFLRNRKKRLDGVVLSGGEPLMQPKILSAVQELKDMGFQVAIHTSGVYTDRFKEILPFLDWVGFDVKAPQSKYDLLTGRSGLAACVYSSLQLLIESDTEYEVRTTLDPRYLTIEDVYQIAKELEKVGVTTYTLQKYRTFDADKNPPSNMQIESFFEDKALLETLQKTFPQFQCRSSD